MTTNSLKTLCAMNLRCDGEHCINESGDVHIIRIDRDNNAHLCEECFDNEQRYNEQLELDGKERIIPDIPFDVYPTLPQEN